MDYLTFEPIFQAKMTNVLNDDPAHDVLHVKRVVKLAFSLVDQNVYIKKDVLFASAWLHDFINLPKNHPDRKKASTLSADGAIEYLKEIKYPTECFDEIHHAICAHSFSANITPKTIEAKLLQDADRLDALGAIGLARLFSVSTQMKISFYSEEDPFAVTRPLEDKLFAIDHIKTKLKIIAQTMNTEEAKRLAYQRISFINKYLDQLSLEI